MNKRGRKKTHDGEGILSMTYKVVDKKKIKYSKPNEYIYMST